MARELLTRGAFTPGSLRVPAQGARPARRRAELLEVTPETISHRETGANPAPKAVWGVLAAMIADEVLRRATTRPAAPRRAIALRT